MDAKWTPEAIAKATENELRLGKKRDEAYEAILKPPYLENREAFDMAWQSWRASEAVTKEARCAEAEQREDRIRECVAALAGIGDPAAFVADAKRLIAEEAPDGNLRDYFAAAAFADGNLRDYLAAAAFATAAESHDWGADWITRSAATAYRIADAMVQERAKPKA